MAPALIHALGALFELVWDKAWPIGAGIGEGTDAAALSDLLEFNNVGSIELSEQDRQLLVLVAAGLKDEAIARQLGLGARTVQRRMSALAHRLGAGNRMDLVRTALHLGPV
jgi:DNA-binding NarL/FixJ family response regulator